MMLIVVDLPAPLGPEQAEHLPAFQLEVDAVDGAVVPVPAMELFDADQAVNRLFWIHLEFSRKPVILPLQSYRKVTSMRVGWIPAGPSPTSSCWTRMACAPTRSCPRRTNRNTPSYAAWRSSAFHPEGLHLVHGSTVATNALLEGDGARTVFITSHGFADTLTIARQARARLYDLQPEADAGPVPPDLCLETGGRLTPDGAVLEPVTDAALAELGARVAALAPEAVAISLLFSFVDDAQERQVAAAMPQGVFVSRSSEVLPEYREYERGVATWLNARLGPLMQRYLERLCAALPGARVTVMQSSAGTIEAAFAADRAVHLLLSGPAGGVLGAARLGALAGQPRLLTFDMGGTSTDVALVDGAPQLTTESELAGYPVAVPMVDMHTIGAGGGSIAWRDAGGALKVGPRSAGADPGPACYGRGGLKPTVTDAHAVLGHLPGGSSMGGTLSLDLDAAKRAVATLGDALGLDLMATAEGILRVADEHMAQALRVISVERGEDPLDFALFPFGGAGGLHVCSLAERLGMRRALFPANAGVLSALGMVGAAPARTVSRTVARPLDEADGIAAIFVELERQATAALVEEGLSASSLTVMRTVELRYRGQSHALEVAWADDAAAAAQAFHELHERRYGHQLELPVELVTLRAQVRAPNPGIRLARRASGAPAAAVSTQRVHGIDGEVPVHAAASLVSGQELPGPAIVTAMDSTLWLASGWSARVDEWGNLALERA
jgi:N-methylhydantoinase A